MVSKVSSGPRGLVRVARGRRAGAARAGRPHVRRSWRLVNVWLLLVLALVASGNAGAAALPVSVIPGAGVGDPNPPVVTDMRLDAAVQELESSQWNTDLAYGFEGYQTIPEVDVDPSRVMVVGQRNACRQNPDYGDELCTFYLTVRAVVPLLRGLTLARAEEEAQNSGLAVVVTQPEPSDERLVADQQPEAETVVAFGERVYVTLTQLSLPPLPDLVGRSLVDARGALDELESRRREVSPNYVQEVRTDPSIPPVPDRRAFVSAQPADCQQPSRVCEIALPVQAQVPALTGMMLENAQRAILDAGLALDPSVDLVDLNREVLDQSLEAGSFAQFGTSVWVELAVRQDWPPLPQVVGIRLDEARAQLDGAAAERARLVKGYVLDVTTDPGIDVSEDRAIVLEEPSDCMDFAPRCPIILVVGAVMPDLRGLTLPEARAATQAAGLVLGTAANAGGSDLHVTGQDPAPGVPTEFDSTVSVQLTGVSPSGSDHPATDETTDRRPGIFDDWRTVGGVVLLLTISAGVLARAVFRGHGRGWVGKHVRAEADPGPISGLTEEVPAAGASHYVRIRAEEGEPQQWVEEVDRS
jgi:beta-lactam-binding protein with PASTA domain